MKRAELLSIAAFTLSIVSFVTGLYFSSHNARTGVRPVLVFEYADASGWSLRNVGNGPALNVLVQHQRATGPWFAPVRTPAMGGGGSAPLPWLGKANIRRLGVSYADADGRLYTSLTENDLTAFKEGDVLPRWPEERIGAYWAQGPIGAQ